MDDVATSDSLIADSRQPEMTPGQLKALIKTSGFAFRGFDQTNLGKSPELLEHLVYGPTASVCGIGGHSRVAGTSRRFGRSRA